MNKIRFKRAQTITEYILLICLLAAGSVVVVTKLGNVIRTQLSNATQTIAGETATKRAADAASGVDQHINRGLDDFWRKQAPPSSRTR